MPFINLKTIKGLLNDEQKQYLMDKFTELLVEVEGGGNAEFKQMVWIQIEEDDPTNWQIGTIRPSAELISTFVKRQTQVKE